MGLGKEIEKLKFDKRLLDANVNRGTVSKAEKDKHLSDLASNVENLGLVRGGGSAAAGDFGNDADSDDDSEQETN